MVSDKRKWLTVALVNLSVVALLGTILRSKILFSLPFVDFKNTLHAHSHFAFGGWVTIALLSLLVHETLSKQYRHKKIYNALQYVFMLNATGMLISFMLQGYGMYSITFSTLFIFTTYVFAWVFIRDISHSMSSRYVRTLAVAAMAYLVLSSAGPFTLAYLMATHSHNVILYKDAIYTYLHLQYNGFFTLAVFALLVNRIENQFSEKQRLNIHRFITVLNFSVIPSLFLSYLWHYPGMLLKLIAVSGSISMVAACYFFLAAILPIHNKMNGYKDNYKALTAIALFAFLLKMALQSLTIFENIGKEVFSNRPVIIGFLHLVLLGFISLYLISHIIQARLLPANRITKAGVITFSTSVIINELLLMTQGLEIMFMSNSQLFPWLLWCAAIGLLAGSILLLVARFSNKRAAIAPLAKQPAPNSMIIDYKHK